MSIDYFPSRMRVGTKIHAQDKSLPGYEESQKKMTYIVNNTDAGDINVWQRLALAIVFQACVDYRKDRYSIEQDECKHKIAKLNHDIIDIEEFFGSAYCRLLIGGKRDYSFLDPENINSKPIEDYERSLRYVSGAGD